MRYVALFTPGGCVAKPNFSFKKRMREQAKEQKRRDKAARKLERANEAKAAGEAGTAEEHSPSEPTATE